MELEEAVEEGHEVAVDVVVIDNVDQEVSVVDGPDEVMGRGVLGVDGLPLALPQRERLVLPDKEGVRVDDGGLHDLLIGPDTPGDGVHDGLALEGDVGDHLAVDIDGLEGDEGELRGQLDQLLEVCARGEELEVGLLVDIAVGRAPADRGVVALGAVHARLAVDGEKAVAVELGKALLEGNRLRLKAVLAPGEVGDLALNVAGKDVEDVGRGGGRRAPQLQTLLTLNGRKKKKERKMECWEMTIKQNGSDRGYMNDQCLKGSPAGRNRKNKTIKVNAKQGRSICAYIVRPCGGGKHGKAKLKQNRR